MILEGIVTTENEDGSANISPMGPKVQQNFTQFELRPYQSSTTYKNLKRTSHGVLHIVDDALLIAQSAINKWIETPELVASDKVKCQRLVDACQSFEFEVTFMDDSADRTIIKCSVIATHEGPRFFGFNRAKHAVLEAAILATRIDFIPIDEIKSQLAGLKVIVEKTAGIREQKAFDLLNDHVNEVK